MKRFIYGVVFISMIFMANEVNAVTSLTYEYDANGNMISGDGKYYEYNDANKLVRVRFGDANGAVIAEYFYDYNGQRIKKVENGITTYYIGKHYEEVRDGTDIKKTDYYFANGERVAKKDSSGDVSYYHSDHLGGTNVITDSSGNLVERTKYYPFGEIRSGGNERYTFTGKEKDQVTDQYYFEARYYNPELTHFTQADTISPNLYDPQDLNRYSYVRNNPLKLIDPSGHKAIWYKPWTWFQKDNTPDEGSSKSSNSEPYKTTDLALVPLPKSSTSPIPIDNHASPHPLPKGSLGDGECTTHAKIRTDHNGRLGYSLKEKMDLMDYTYNPKQPWKVHPGNILVIDVGNYGHVVVVEEVRWDTSEFFISEQNYPYVGAPVNTRVIPMSNTAIKGGFNSDFAQ